MNELMRNVVRAVLIICLGMGAALKAEQRPPQSTQNFDVRNLLPRPSGTQQQRTQPGQPGAGQGGNYYNQQVSHAIPGGSSSSYDYYSYTRITTTTTTRSVPQVQRVVTPCNVCFATRRPVYY